MYFKKQTLHIFIYTKKIKINNFDYKTFMNISYIKGSQLVVAENLEHTYIMYSYH